MAGKTKAADPVASGAFEIVIRGDGDLASVEKAVQGVLDGHSGGIRAEMRDVGGPNPQVRRLGKTERKAITAEGLAENKHGEGYAAAAPPPLKITGAEEGQQPIGSIGPLSPPPATMAANDGVDEAQSTADAAKASEKIRADREKEAENREAETSDAATARLAADLARTATKGAGKAPAAKTAKAK